MQSGKSWTVTSRRPASGATPTGEGGRCDNNGIQVMSGDRNRHSNQIRAIAVLPGSPRRPSSESYCTRICPANVFVAAEVLPGL